MAGAPRTRSLNYNADTQQWEWTLAWIDHILPTHPTQLFNGNVFAPERGVLAYSDPVIVPALLVAPVRWLGGSPVLAFNLGVIAGLALTAWATWFVAWRWTGSATAALVAAALGAFNQHYLTRLPHFQGVHAWGIPLAIYFADTLVERVRSRDAIWLALIVAATAATSLYTLAFVGLVAGVAALVALPRWKASAAILGAYVLGIVIVLPILWPYVRIGAAGVARPLEMVAQFSATPTGYLSSKSVLDAGWSKPFFRDDVNVLFAGFAALALAGLGVIRARAAHQTWRRIALLVGLAIAGVVFSLGPSTPVYRLVYAWFTPIRGLRAAARFAALYLFAVSLFAAIAIAWLQSRLRSIRAGAIVAGVALAAVTIEAWSGPVPTEPFNGVSSVYTVLAQQTSPVMLAELPFYVPEVVHLNGEYMVNATGHWKPVMNGYSGFTPDSYRRRAAAFWFFPEPWAIEAMKKEGVTHVVIHREKFTAGENAQIDAALGARTDFQLLAADGDHRLYSLK
jgi:hypothetical protein